MRRLLKLERSKVLTEYFGDKPEFVTETPAKQYPEGKLPGLQNMSTATTDFLSVLLINLP
jgi:hypothetical protein